MAYRTSAISLTLSDLESYAPMAGLLKRDYLFSCAADHKISTDIARRAVPLR